MQCILRTTDVLTMAVRALGVVLLFSLVTTLLGLPTTVPGKNINYTLSKKEGTRSLQLYLLRDLSVLNVFFLNELNDVSRIYSAYDPHFSFKVCPLVRSCGAIYCNLVQI